MNVVELTQQLIRTKGFVSKTHDEAAIAQLLYDLLSADDRLSVRKQFVADNRFNVVATTSGEPTLLLAGHMDTVQVCDGWTVDPFAAKVEGDKLFGLGSLDMLGGIAAIITATRSVDPLPRGLTLLFYCDEEYNFAGMKTFVNQVEWKTPPQLGVVGEPSDLKVWNAHRGIIELELRVRGRSAHASRPSDGVNAIVSLVEACRTVERLMASDLDDTLGATTLNLASIQGGLGGNGDAILHQPNAVPDTAVGVVDVRVSSPRWSVERLEDELRRALQPSGADLKQVTVRHDLGSLNTAPESIAPLIKAMKNARIPAEFADCKTKGYGDGQLLAEAFNMAVVNFGPSGEGIHSPDEFVSVDSLFKTQRVYEALLEHPRG